jgi:hypothetical protein
MPPVDDEKETSDAEQRSLSPNGSNIYREPKEEQYSSEGEYVLFEHMSDDT